MGAKKSRDESSLMEGAHKYFVQNVLPHNVQARLHSVSRPTSLFQNREETFLLVRSGSGSLVVNGLEYKLRPDTLAMLGPFHSYRLVPDLGKTLDLYYAQINCETYVYMIANPYYRQRKMIVPSEPAVAQLSGVFAEIARQSMEGLLEECRQDQPDKFNICICYMNDLFGIIVEEMGKKHSKRKKRAQTPGNKPAESTPAAE